MIHYRNIQIRPALAAAFLALAAATPEALAESLHVSHLKCEGLDPPTLVDTAQPPGSFPGTAKELNNPISAWNFLGIPFRVGPTASSPAPICSTGLRLPIT